MTTSDKQPRPMLWAAAFIASMALIAVAQIFDLIARPVSFILMLLAMFLIIPMARAGLKRQEQKGAMSPALRVYNRRVLGVMAAYMIAMFGAAYASHEVPGDSPLLWVLAVLPLIPLFGMFWTMIRYYRDEDDEYLRHRAVSGSLIGLIMVLVIGTSWGFLEMFGLVPHIWNWWVFPVWAIGLGIGNCWPRRDGEEPEE